MMPHPILRRVSKTDRASFQTFIHAGTANARSFTRAHALLKAADGWSDAQSCEAFGISRNTSIQVRQRYLAGGVEAVLSDKKQQRHRQALTGEQAAHLIAVSCTPVPDGHDHWTLRLVAGTAVAWGFVESISPETIRSRFKKKEITPWPHEQWCIPEGGAACVAAMEDGLDLHEEEEDPRYPVITVEEKLVTRHADVRTPLPAKPGQPERIDDEEERLGTAHLLFLVEPLAGWRHVDVTERRTTLDDAEQIRWLVDRAYPHAEDIRMVQDHLHTHTPAAISEAFPPEEARRILRRVEFHDTPKHGSWLHRAEIEIGIFQRGCLSRRTDCVGTVRRRIHALEIERNRARRTISWQFTCRDARSTLSHVYPEVKHVKNNLA